MIIRLSRSRVKLTTLTAPVALTIAVRLESNHDDPRLDLRLGLEFHELDSKNSALSSVFCLSTATIMAVAATAPMHGNILSHVQSLSAARQATLSDLESEYDAARSWLDKAIESSRRQILESAGLSCDDLSSAHDDKRRRVGSLGRPGGTRSVADEHQHSATTTATASGANANANAKSLGNKENGHPNAMEIDEQQQQQQSTKAAVAARKPPAAGNGKSKAKKGAGSKKKKKETEGATSTSASAAAIPPALDVYSLKVAQLRAELRSRGMNAAGLKRDLQARLAERIEEEAREASAAAVAAAAEEEEEEEESSEGEEEDMEEDTKKQHSGEVVGSDVDDNLEEADEMNVEEGEIEQEQKKSEMPSPSPSPIPASATLMSPAQMAAASDFPGVDVKAHSAKKVSAKKVSTSSAVSTAASAKKVSVANEERMDTYKQEEKEATKGDDDDANESSVDYDDAMEVDSTAPVVSASKGDDIDDQEDDVDMVDAEKEREQQVPPPSSTAHRVTTSEGHPNNDNNNNNAESSKSPKMPGIGKKILKATANLFSPSKVKSPKNEEEKQQPQQQQQQISPSATTSNTTTTNAAAMVAPPSERKVKEANDFFSKFASTEQAGAPTQASAAAAPSASKLGSALKTPALRAGLAPAAPSTKSISGGSKGSAASGTKTSSAFNIEKSQQKIRELQENAAIRRARLAELRAKSKPVPVAESDGAAAMSSRVLTSAKQLSAMKAKTMSTAEKQKEEKRKILAAQMREKHFAESAAAAKKQQTATTSTASGSAISETTATKMVVPPPEIASQQQQQHQHQLQQQPSVPVIPPMKKHEPSQQQQQKQSSQKHHPTSSSTSKPKTPSQPVARPEILSPMDTYEMSDRDQSESDSSDYDSEEDKPRKKIPKWAQKHNLIPALERQFMDGPQRLDPDEIFPEVSTCNLELIFDQKKSRYKKRTSSANWAKDRVTAAEKLVYKRTMGFGGKKR